MHLMTIVTFGRVDSELKPQELGVVQGSKFRSILFDVYSSNFVNTSRKCTLYADDAALFIVGSSLQELVLCVNGTLQKVKSMCESNKLRLNET